MQEFEVIFYTQKSGYCPVRIFLDSLDIKMRAKMLRTIAMLQANGYELREPYSKLLDDGIFELRAKQGNNITRVLYFFVVGRKIILTNGFLKKTQKTPAAEISLAKKTREEYMHRGER